MPGIAFPDPTPSWLKKGNESVLDPWWRRVLRPPARIIGADNPASQVMGLLGTHVPGPDAPLTALAQGVKQTASDLIEKARAGIRAWHVSPHDFDRFDISKVGTGQGAASYGHGIYAAENPAVKEDYIRYFNEGRDRPVEGGGSLPNWVAKSLRDSMHNSQHHARNIERLLTEFKARIGEAEERVASQAPQYWNDESKIPGLREVVQGLENVKRGAPVKSAARVYEVNLNVDPKTLLDWDVSLLNQPEHVREAFTRAYGRPPEQLVPGATGADAYQLAGHGDERQASEALRRAGIPGLRYLDEGSRIAGKAGVFEAAPGKYLIPGSRASYPTREAAQAALDASGQVTRNYVMFDDSVIDILRKYGLLPPLGGGAALARTAAANRRDSVGTPPPVAAPRAPRAR